jgi:predicted TIM-barrel fold metal-dependent hydrolase
LAADVVELVLCVVERAAGADVGAGESHAILRGLLDTGRAWMKLSGAYYNTDLGAPYADAGEIARAFVKAAPDRVVWGSDWPHPSAVNKPDDSLLFDLLTEWAPDEATRHRILVRNPEALYGFEASSA